MLKASVRPSVYRKTLSPGSSFIVRCSTGSPITTPSAMAVRVSLSMLPSRFTHKRRVVPGDDVGQLIIFHIEHSIDSRHKHTLTRIGDQQVIDTFIASAGEVFSITAARTRVRVSAMKSAAGTPLSATSAMKSPSRLSGRSNTS